jgi:hypothetical protein
MSQQLRQALFNSTFPENRELEGARAQLKNHILAIYTSAPKTLSAINSILKAEHQGNAHWAFRFMQGRRNALYTSEQLFIVETLTECGILGGPRTLESVLGDAVVFEILSLWDKGCRNSHDISARVNGLKKEGGLGAEGELKAVTVEEVREVLVGWGRMGTGRVDWRWM